MYPLGLVTVGSKGDISYYTMESFPVETERKDQHRHLGSHLGWLRGLLKST